MNLLNDEVVPDLANVRAIIMGGSGEVHLNEDHSRETWFLVASNLMNEVIKREIPMLGICFGFQFIALHQGAKVVLREGCDEVGSFAITNFPAAKEDPLFKNLPDTYIVQEGHNLVVEDLPDHLELLARSERVPIQAFKMKGKPVWGVLFHVELDKRGTEERVNLYDDDDYDYTGGVGPGSDLLKESPEANKLLGDFLEYAFRQEEILAGQKSNV